MSSSSTICSFICDNVSFFVEKGFNFMLSLLSSPLSFAPVCVRLLLSTRQREALVAKLETEKRFSTVATSPPPLAAKPPIPPPPTRASTSTDSALSSLSLRDRAQQHGGSPYESTQKNLFWQPSTAHTTAIPMNSLRISLPLLLLRNNNCSVRPSFHHRHRH
jgi:hypothetical protein